MTSEDTNVVVNRYRAYKHALEITPDDETETRRALKKAIYKAFDAVIEQYELPLLESTDDDGTVTPV